ncbi:hypothetical protein [Nocardia carnea]|uniref:Uncharacterized protein n=1 Tax=Nocardia carnea TaxID=37328 RepID=A0ABW7TSP5_9NOCA|nr:hypothetical protein [Nocardia carnea]
MQGNGTRSLPDALPDGSIEVADDHDSAIPGPAPSRVFGGDMPGRGIAGTHRALAAIDTEGIHS